MPVFRYTSIDQDGRRSSGRMTAPDRETVLRQLNDQGQFPVDAEVEDGSSGASAGGNWRFWRGPSQTEITNLTRELAMLLKSGLSLGRSMTLIAEEASSARLGKLARRLHGALASGRSFHEALAGEGGAFSASYVGMIRVAEATGSLPEVLERIADTREREQRLRAKILSALMYPSLIVVTAIAAVSILMVVVVPRFKQMLAHHSGPLPASAARIIAASDWLNANGELAIAGALTVLALAFFGSRSALFRRRCFSLMLHVPGVGNLLRSALAVQFCRSLGVLLASGVSLSSAMSLTREVVANESARHMIDKLGLVLRQGGDFVDVIAESDLFPSRVPTMMRVGTETGNLSSACLYLAETFETRFETSMQRLVTVLEPTVVIVVSLFVALIVMSIVSAIMGVYELGTL